MKYKVHKGVSYLTPANAKKKTAGKEYQETRLNPGEIVSASALKDAADGLVDLGAIVKVEEEEEVADAR